MKGEPSLNWKVTFELRSWVVGRRQSGEDWEQNVPRRRNNRHKGSRVRNRGVVEEEPDGPGARSRTAHGRLVGSET